MFKLSFMSQSPSSAATEQRHHEQEVSNTTGFLDRVRRGFHAYKTTPAFGEISVADRYFLFGGAPAPYNPNELISRKGYRIIDEMRKDDQVKAASYFKKQSVLASGWDIKAPKDRGEDWEPKLFVEDALKRVGAGGTTAANVESNFEHCLLEMMTALDYGFSLTERVLYEIEEGKWKGKIGLKKLATRKPHDVGLTSDIHGNLSEVKQGVTVLPMNRMILFTYDREFSNHYGRTDLEAAYRPWWYKENAYKWMGMLLERMGVPPIFAMYNSSDYKGENLTLLRSVLQRMQVATTGTIPRGNKDSLEMWSPELAGQVSTVFIPAVQQYNQDIARAQLMPGLLGFTQDQVQGSLARARVHFDVFLLSIERLRNDIAELVNEQIIWPLVSFNYPLQQAEMPYLEWMPLTEDNKQELLKSWAELVGAKVVGEQDDDEVHIRAALQFPELDEKAQAARAKRRQEMMPVPQPGLVDRRQPGQPGQPPQLRGGTPRPPLTHEQFELLVERFVG